MQRVNICRDVMMERKQAAAYYWSTVSALVALINGESAIAHLESSTEEALVDRLTESLRAIEHAYDPAELIVAWQPPVPPIDYSKIKPKPAPAKPIIDGDLEPNWSELDTSHDEPLIVINRVNLDPFAPLDDFELIPLDGEHPDIQ